MSFRQSLCCFLLALSAPACVSRAPVVFEEVDVAPEATPVSYAHCYATANAFYAVGGLRVREDLKASSAKGFTFNLNEKAWNAWSEKEELTEFRPSASAKIGNDIYIFSSDASKPGSNELRVYHSDQNLWEKLSVSTRVKTRSAPTLTAVGDDLVLFGGKTADQSSNWAIYNTRSKQWRVFGDFNTELSSHIAVAFRSKVLIWGGFEKGKRTKNGYILDPSNGDVKPLAAMPFLNERANAKAVATDDKLWIIGGMSNDGPTTDGAYYDDVFKNWKRIPPLPEGGRKDFELALIPDRGVLLWGGRLGNMSYATKSYLLDIDTREWSEVLVPNAPTARIAHCLGTVGERLYIYGGIGAQTVSEKLWMIPFDDIQLPN